MSHQTSQEKLIEQIELAFNDTQPPNEENLVSRVEHLDSLKVLIAFKGKHWKEIAHEVILHHRFDISRFTPEAFRFYLPAYLIASLQGEDRGEIIDFVISSLDPREQEGKFRDEFLNKLVELTLEQKVAIKSFIKYYIETRTYLIPDDERVEKFWESYLV